MTDNRPIKTFRQGSVGASIWLAHTAAGVFYDVTFARCWKDEPTGEYLYTQRFSDRHLLQLVEVANAAKTWIAELKANAQTVTNTDDQQTGVSV